MSEAPTIGNIQNHQAVAAKPQRADRWLVGFAILHLACQMLLLVPGISALRLIVRTGTFGVGLAFLVIIPRGRRVKLAIENYTTFILVILVLEAFHPDGSSPLGALAAVVLNLAILAPVFWVPRTSVTAITFQRLIMALWIYYTASAALGVLQSYFPGQFEPALSSVVKEYGKGQVMSLQIQLTSGDRIFRPMGLTDVPGGAAYGALYAVLLGTGVFVLPKAPFFGARAIAVGSMSAGIMCLFLCQIRSLMVMVGICLVTLIALLAVSGRVTRLFGLLAAVGGVTPPAFALAVSLGGRSMTDRVSSLTQFDAETVYYSHRGYFLEATIYDYLPRWPLGAGLGRWGMLAHYFGTRGSFLWAEIQWTAWVFDGGLPLTVAYCSAITVSTISCFRIALGRIGGSEPSLSLWGAVLVAYNVGTLALCFSYVPFIGTAGVEFWLLNIALLCAAHNSDAAVLRTKAAA